MKNISITNHGFDRVLERTKCKKEDVRSYIAKVWSTGKTIETYREKSSIAKYLRNVRNANEDREIRVKGNFLYLFNKVGSAFITCYQIPEKVMQSRR